VMVVAEGVAVELAPVAWELYFHPQTTGESKPAPRRSSTLLSFW
jgi:hypothetical protein